MFVNLITLLGSIGSLLGALTLYMKAVGKNKTDISAIVNEQIKLILENKDGTIGRLESNLNEVNVKYDKLNDKVEVLLHERAEDKSTISRLTNELSDEVRDKNYWKKLYEDMKEKYEELKRRFKDEH